MGNGFNEFKIRFFHELCLSRMSLLFPRKGVHKSWRSNVLVRVSLNLNDSQINCIRRIFYRVRRDAAYLFDRDFLTYEDIEAYLEVPVSTYHRIESGDISRMPTDKTLSAILRYATTSDGDAFTSIEAMKQYILSAYES